MPEQSGESGYKRVMSYLEQLCAD